MMLEQVGYIAVGLVFLVFGADWLVKGASRLALASGVAPLVVGLTVVAFGTSAPELAVSVRSAWIGESDIAVANAVGSNLFNLLFILGASALVAPLVVHQQLVRLDVPIMIGTAVLLFILGADGTLDLWDSALLTALIVAYTAFLIVEARREKNSGITAEYADEVSDAAGGEKGSLPGNLVFIVAGLVALAVGARWLVDGAVAVALTLGVSQVVVGLTVVAAGTSLPELATSMLAAYRGERDIAIGNIVGSNIFNVCSVLGFSGLAASGNLEVSQDMRELDIPLMIVVSLACLPFFRAGYTLTRARGAVFLLCYGLYVCWLVMSETGSALLDDFQALLFSLVLPALVVGIVVMAVAALRREDDSQG